MSQCAAYGELDRMRTAQHTSDTINTGSNVNTDHTITANTYETVPIVL